MLVALDCNYRTFARLASSLFMQYIDVTNICTYVYCFSGFFLQILHHIQNYPILTEHNLVYLMCYVLVWIFCHIQNSPILTEHNEVYPMYSVLVWLRGRYMHSIYTVDFLAR